LQLLRVPNPLYRDRGAPPATALGGGGLVSTAEDYARFAQLLLTRGEWGDKRIVSAEALLAQMTNQLPEPLLAKGFHAGHMDLRPGFGHGYNAAVFHDPALTEAPGRPPAQSCRPDDAPRGDGSRVSCGQPVTPEFLPGPDGSGSPHPFQHAHRNGERDLMQVQDGDKQIVEREEIDQWRTSFPRWQVANLDPVRS
jgi:CubicO group peptidase (beta-lactamase class C family)